MSDEIIDKAIKLIQDMTVGDPGRRVQEKLIELESQLEPGSEYAKQFGDIWEAYLVSTL